MSAFTIQQAALTPPIYREMWDRYGNDVPPEEALRYEFVVQRGFTENGFRDFLRVYRDTVSFARLSRVVPVEAAQDVAVQDGDGGRKSPVEKHEPSEEQSLSPSPARATEYQVPVAPGVNVSVKGQFPLSSKAWTQFMAVLVAMRPALVEEIEVTEP